MTMNVLLTQFFDSSSGFPVANSTTYLLQIYLPVMVWMILVFIVFYFLLRKYTFGNWTVDNPNPYFGETFDMPRGVFRGTLTLTLLFVSVMLELVSVHTPGFEDNVHEFLVAFQMMIAFYFGSKVMHHVTSADKHKVKAVAENQTLQKKALLAIKHKAKAATASTPPPAPESDLTEEEMLDMEEEMALAHAHGDLSDDTAVDDNSSGEDDFNDPNAQG